MKETIQYAGTTLYFIGEVDSIDEAQALIDSYKKNGVEAACTHYDDKHQFYAGVKVDGRRDKDN